jgi:hypothetical protein
VIEEAGITEAVFSRYDALSPMCFGL